MDDIFEAEMEYIDDIFEIKGYDRNLLIVFRNAMDSKSKHDMSNYIQSRYPHINLSFIDNDVPYSRVSTMQFNQDNASTIDILSIFTRLMDDDMDEEYFLDREYDVKTNILFNNLMSIIKENNYKNIFIEKKYIFEYNWLETLKNVINKDINIKLVEDF